MCTVSATGAKVGVTHTADRHAADRLAHAPNSGTRTWGAPRPSVLARPPVASHQIGGGTASVLARGVHEARAPSNARPPWRCKTPDREAAARTFAPAPPSARCSLVLGCSSWRPLSPPSGASAVPRFWNLPRRAGLRAFSPPSVAWKKEALSTHYGRPSFLPHSHEPCKVRREQQAPAWCGPARVMAASRGEAGTQKVRRGGGSPMGWLGR